jgi:hypothetical protein
MQRIKNSDGWCDFMAIRIGFQAITDKHGKVSAHSVVKIGHSSRAEILEIFGAMEVARSHLMKVYEAKREKHEDVRGGANSDFEEDDGSEDDGFE